MDRNAPEQEPVQKESGLHPSNSSEGRLGQFTFPPGGREGNGEEAGARHQPIHTLDGPLDPIDGAGVIRGVPCRIIKG